MPPADLISRAPALVKICSATHLETLIRQALAGLAMSHVISPPRENSCELNYQYFQPGPNRSRLGDDRPHEKLLGPMFQPHHRAYRPSPKRQQPLLVRTDCRPSASTTCKDEDNHHQHNEHNKKICDEKQRHVLLQLARCSRLQRWQRRRWRRRC